MSYFSFYSFPLAPPGPSALGPPSPPSPPPKNTKKESEISADFTDFKLSIRTKERQYIRPRTPLTFYRIRFHLLLKTSMEAPQEIRLETGGNKISHPSFIDREPDSLGQNTRKPTHYRWWILVILYIFFLLVGQSVGTLLGRLYFNKGGNSKWLITFVQTAGFPILVPLLFLLPSTPSFEPGPKPTTLVYLYVVFGFMATGDNLMYSYGLLYLPVSTYSLLCATQLAFNAIFSFFINSYKFTALILNSLVLLTLSAALLATNKSAENLTETNTGKYVIGFLCTIGASVTAGLYLSLLQFSFQRIIRKETFSVVLNMQIYTSLVATCGCMIGLFASGEWKSLSKEMREYEKGKTSYLLNLIGIAITWQVTSIGLLGLIFEVSSLFSNVISTLGLPIVPVLAVIFFHDKMNTVKVIALILALWGFASYIYQHYLDDAKAKKTQDE